MNIRLLILLTLSIFILNCSENAIQTSPNVSGSSSSEITDEQPLSSSPPNLILNSSNENSYQSSNDSVPLHTIPEGISDSCFYSNYPSVQQKCDQNNHHCIDSIYATLVQTGGLPKYTCDTALLNLPTGDSGAVEIVYPKNHAQGIARDTLVLKWNAGEASRFSVIIYNELNPYTRYRNFTSIHQDSIQLINLPPATTFYWKVNAYVNDSIIKGDMYTFTTTAHVNMKPRMHPFDTLFLASEQLHSIPLPVYDPDGDVLEFTTKGLPNEINVEPINSEYVLQWTPSGNSYGLTQTTITVRDTGSPSTYEKFDIFAYINYTPYIVQPDMFYGDAGSPLTISTQIIEKVNISDIVKTDEKIVYIVNENYNETMKIAAHHGVHALDVSPDNTITWSPTANDTGTQIITLIATDSGPPLLSDTVELELTVRKADDGQQCETADCDLLIYNQLKAEYPNFYIGRNNTGGRVTHFIMEHKESSSLSTTQFPTKIFKFSAVISLELGGFAPLSFPSEAPNLPHLKTLEINSCVPKGYLGYDSNNSPGTTVLPEFVYQMTTITTLNIDACHNYSISEKMSNLDSLQSIQHSDALYVSKNLFLPPNIKEIKITEGKFSNLPFGIGAAKTLEELYIHSFEYLEEIPSEIGELQSLKTLDITVEAERFPEEFSALDNLEELYLYTKFPYFPKGIEQLAQLKSLTLHGPDVTELDMNLNNLPVIEELIIKVDSVKSVPKNIGDLTSLITFTLQATSELHYSNGFPFPSEWYSLSNLVELQLNNINIHLLPTGISGLSQLEVLSLIGGNVSSMPSDLQDLTLLKTIALDNNSLTSIPSGISHLQNLTHLSLTNNSISDISETLKNHPNLTILQLYENTITTVPHWLTELPLLHTTDLRHNSICDGFPPNIDNISTTQLRSYQNCE